MSNSPPPRPVSIAAAAAKTLRQWDSNPAPFAPGERDCAGLPLAMLAAAGALTEAQVKRFRRQEGHRWGDFGDGDVAPQMARALNNLRPLLRKDCEMSSVWLSGLDGFEFEDGDAAWGITPPGGEQGDGGREWGGMWGIRHKEAWWGAGRRNDGMCGVAPVQMKPVLIGRFFCG